MSFFKEFLNNPGMIGAIAPSSNALGEMITEAAGVSTAKTIVELGPGTGVFFKKIMDKKTPESLFFCLELCERFVALLKEQIPELLVYEDSAENISKYLAKHSLKECDCIVSGLPWASFSDSLQERILNSVSSSLSSGGIFVTFAYIIGIVLPSGRRFKKMLSAKFSYVQITEIVWRNLPPAFVYRCVK